MTIYEELINAYDHVLKRTTELFQYEVDIDANLQHKVDLAIQRLETLWAITTDDEVKRLADLAIKELQEYKRYIDLFDLFFREKSKGQ